MAEFKRNSVGCICCICTDCPDQFQADIEGAENFGDCDTCEDGTWDHTVILEPNTLFDPDNVHFICGDTQIQRFCPYISPTQVLTCRSLFGSTSSIEWDLFIKDNFQGTSQRLIHFQLGQFAIGTSGEFVKAQWHRLTTQPCDQLDITFTSADLCNLTGGLFHCDFTNATVRVRAL